MFSVNSLEYPYQDQDQEFEDLEDAEDAARNMSYNDSVIAVRDTETDEIVSLVYQQVVYNP